MELSRSSPQRGPRFSPPARTRTAHRSTTHILNGTPLYSQPFTRPPHSRGSSLASSSTSCTSDGEEDTPASSTCSPEVIPLKSSRTVEDAQPPARTSSLAHRMSQLLDQLQLDPTEDARRDSNESFESSSSFCLDEAFPTPPNRPAVQAKVERLEKENLQLRRELQRFQDELARKERAMNEVWCW
ncbi:hypothetical protein PSEUBRA_001066 [Kalmanozyma brasiliensis GHG001]|uniref:uncharacterized protein n=1 Tax=Kalmanozyma brasiliensis (strain GHG001) TaxID=1365824 RepID=UPI002867DFBB|nr:uncharacterized protein PSEUBRA_001066 [Kalmanozyma brasiliensis GHG001]KAF6766885.1 hypothetical protein PSEUBRA_001066 [Kalmanozyma brasiliensis GHG001]